MYATTTLSLAPHLPDVFGSSMGLISPSVMAFSIFAIAVFLAVIYSLIAIYHWTRYGHKSPVSIPAICVHIFMSLAFIGFAASGL